VPFLEELQRAPQPSHGGQAPWLGTPVDAAAAVGKQTGGRQDAGKVAPPGSASQQRRSRPKPPLVPK